MNRVKIFAQEVSNQDQADALATIVNQWLAERVTLIQIVERFQSSAATETRYIVTITIFYVETVSK